MSAWLYTIISVLIISLISLIGVFTLSLKRERLKNLSLSLVSFAAGALFGDAFIHLLPEAFEKMGTETKTSLYVLAGVLIFFILEKFLRWRHCHIESHKEFFPLAAMNLVGDAVHNFIDGLLIGATYMVSIPVGIATSLAIIFHEIPQEIGDFGVLIHAGLSVRKALVFNFFSAVIAILGAFVSLLIGPKVEGFAVSLLPIAAGGFIYIAGADLIPELKHECELGESLRQLVLIVLGIAIMALLVLVE